MVSAVARVYPRFHTTFRARCVSLLLVEMPRSYS